MRGIVVLSGFLIVACASPFTRGTIIQFFPPLADETLQAASLDAVVRVLHHHGATISSSASAEVRASIGLDCSGRRGVVEFRFARNPGPQTVGVRICPSGNSRGECVEGAADVRPAGPCRDSTARLLSSIEHDLAESLVGRVALANRGPRRWWGGLSLGSLESLLLLSHPTERNEWWRDPDGPLAAKPLWGSGRVAALQTTRSRAVAALTRDPTSGQQTGRSR